MQERFLPDEELRDARALIGRMFWVGPIIATLFFLVSAWFVAGEKDVAIKTIFLAGLGSIAIGFWLVRILQYQRFAADIQARIVDVVNGPQNESG